MKTKPKFITFEGADGSGKTTALNLLIKYLDKNYPKFNYIFTREPGGTITAEAIRNVILNKKNKDMTSATEALLFAAARRQHLETKIWPALKEGKVVLCDRYVDSSLAYQGNARNLGIQYVASINNLATKNTKPDLTFFFDIKPKEADKRVNKRSEKDRLELPDSRFREDVYKGYKKIIKADPKRFVIIDASKSKDEVLEQIIKVFKTFI